MLKIVKKISEWKKIRRGRTFSDKSIGFVPTMGALHEGHIALFKKSLLNNDITIASIFINPTQFNNPKDLKNYPVTLKDDLNILKDLRVDYLLFPEYKEIYHDNYTYKIIETSFSKVLCGEFRRGHFDGVLTVVMKLLNLVKPDKAYFGEKDYQQLQLIKGMIQSFFLDVKIVSVPTIREKDGLAYSSRNLKLTKKEREKAGMFPKILSSDLSLTEIKKKLCANGFKIEYVEQIDQRKFAAVYLGKVRLIDNVKA